jgi:hypothetical protein
MFREFIIFLEENINSFTILIKDVIKEKKEEIDDIKIDNPSITEFIELFS